MMKDL